MSLQGFSPFQRGVAEQQKLPGMLTIKHKMKQHTMNTHAQFDDQQIKNNLLINIKKYLPRLLHDEMEE